MKIKNDNVFSNGQYKEGVWCYLNFLSSFTAKTRKFCIIFLNKRIGDGNVHVMNGENVNFCSLGSLDI